MKFGKTLQLAQNTTWNQKWADSFVNYKLLKQHIKQLLEDPAAVINEVEDAGKAAQLFRMESMMVSPPNGDGGEGDALASRMDRRASIKSSKQRSFVLLLRREFHKVENFFRAQIPKMYTRLDQMSVETKNMDAKSADAIRKKVRGVEFTKARMEEFLDLNTTAIRKIIKKFDKKVLVSHSVALLTETLDPKIDSFEELHKEALEKIQKAIDEFVETHCKQSVMTPSDMDAADLAELKITDEIPMVHSLQLDSYPPESISKQRLQMVYDGVGAPISVPVIIVRGKFEGPVLGLTAALHGNELNGIPLINKLIRELDVSSLKGTLVAVPCLNVPGMLRHQRGYMDGQDLNRLFPGKPNGNCGQIYCHFVMENLVRHLDYLVDIHTASFGRINTLYVRADMNHKDTYQMALLQRPQIIVHNTAPDGSLRSAAMKCGAPCITVEIGNPGSINTAFVKRAYRGVELIMDYLGMTVDDNDDDEDELPPPTMCSRSFWIFSQHGGLINVIPDINTWVAKDQVIARVRSVFGDIVAVYRAPEDGIVVGKNVDPVCASGDRILHLGVVGHNFAAKANDGH